MTTTPQPMAQRHMPDWLFALQDAQPVAVSGPPPEDVRSHIKRLRHRFSLAGPGALPDDELLELVLCRTLRRTDAKVVASVLLTRFGDYNRVISAPIARLMETRHVTRRVAQDLKIVEASAHRLARSRVMNRPLISSWEALIDYCHTAMAHRETEQFRVFYLDRKNTLIADEEQGRGTVDHVPVYPREVVKRALELNASALILVHNHPSGDPTPSPADIAMTAQIRRAAEALDLQLHDHIIVGQSRELSFRSAGYL